MPEHIPKQSVSYRFDAITRAQLRAIQEHEDRSTESDTIRALIKRAYRALPRDAQTVEPPIRRDEAEP